MKLVFDSYTRKARIAPALLVVLPVGVAGMMWFPSEIVAWRALAGLVVWSGGALLIAEFGRYWGQKKEPDLFESWGGKPTTRALRHRDANNHALLQRRHEMLGKLMSRNLPTAEDERNDPGVADEVYETGVDILRERTRDSKQFPLVFEENCNYGFRRNLWAMKPLGVVASFVGFLAIASMLVFREVLGERAGSPSEPVVGLLLCLLFIVMWLFWIKPSWVERAERHTQIVFLDRWSSF